MSFGSLSEYCEKQLITMFYGAVDRQSTILLTYNDSDTKSDFLVPLLSRQYLPNGNLVSRACVSFVCDMIGLCCFLPQYHNASSIVARISNKHRNSGIYSVMNSKYVCSVLN